MTSNKYDVGDTLEGECLELSIGQVQQKAKPMGRRPVLEETWPNHAIGSSVAINQLLLGCDIRKKKNNNNSNNKKEKHDFCKSIYFM